MWEGRGREGGIVIIYWGGEISVPPTPPYETLE